MIEENKIIIPELINLEENIRKDVFNRLKITDGSGIRGDRNGRLDTIVWKFPEIIAITSWTRDSSGYDEIYEGTWDRHHYLDLVSLNLKEFKQFEYSIIHTEMRREKRFNTAINSYEESAGQIFQRDNSVVVPITQKWYSPKDNERVAWGKHGWLRQSLDREEQKEVTFEIPTNLIK